MKNKKEHSAMIGFWLVLGAKKEHPLMVCPALISNKAIEKIESVSKKKAWDVSIQSPVDTHEKAVMVMIPEIINIILEKDVSEYSNLWEIEGVKTKCEDLATKYIKEFKLAIK